MEWVYRSLMAASVIVGGLVSAHVIPADFSAMVVAIAAAAGYFSTREGAAPIYIDGEFTPTVPVRPRRTRESLLTATEERENEPEAVSKSK